MSIATPETSASATPLPGSGPVPVPAPVYVDGMPAALATPPVSPASQANRGQRFWSSVPRPISSNIQENLFVSLPQPKTINYLTFDLAHFPQQFTVSWLDSSGQWHPVLWQNGTPMVITVTGSVPLIVNNSAALAAGMNPYHYGAGHWDHFDEIIAPFTTTQMMFSGIRAPAAGLPNFTQPIDAAGNPSPYPLGIRDLDFGYRVLTKGDVPYMPRSASVVSERQPFAQTTDVHGSPMTVSVRENRASDLLTGAGPWCSAPQLRSDAVVNLYVDARTPSGQPQVIDGFRLQPITSGVKCNLYYAPSPPPSGATFTSSDTPLVSPAVQAAGTSLPQASNNGLLFANSPSSIQVSAQAAGITSSNPWWVAAAFQPQFPSMAAVNALVGQDANFAGGIGNWSGVESGNTTVAPSTLLGRSVPSCMAMTSLGAGNVWATNAHFPLVVSLSIPVTIGQSVSAGAWFQAATASRNCRAAITWWNNQGIYNSGVYGIGSSDFVGSWSYQSISGTSPINGVARLEVWVLNVPGANETHYIADPFISASPLAAAAASSYMLADAGAFQVYYQNGSITMSMAGGNPAAAQSVTVNPFFNAQNIGVWGGYIWSNITPVSSPTLPGGSPYPTGALLTPQGGSPLLATLQTVNVTPNTVYTASVLAYHNGADLHQQGFQVDWFTANGTPITSTFSFQTLGPQNTWNAYTNQFSIVAPPNAATAHFYPIFRNDGSTPVAAQDFVYVTACELVPNAAPVTTLGTWTLPFAANDQLIFTIVYDGQNLHGGLYWQGWQQFSSVSAPQLPPVATFSLATSQPQTNTGTSQGAAFSLMYGNYLLTAMAIGQQQLSMTNGPDPLLQQFASNAGGFVYKQDGTGPQNVALRFAPQFILPASVPVSGGSSFTSVNPWGFVGGATSAYQSCKWIPVCRDFKLAAGLMEFEPVLASAFKFEFTSLAAEPFDFLAPVPVSVQKLPVNKTTAPLQLTAPKPVTHDTGLAVNQNLAPTVTFADVPAPQAPYASGSALPRQAVHAETPALADQLVTRGGSLYNFQSFKPAATIPVQAAAGIHTYSQSQHNTHSRIAYFVALSGITMYRNNYQAQDNAEEYTELFGDQANYSLSAGSFPQLSWKWSAGQLSTGSDFLAFTGVATAVSAIFPSEHNVTGVQFATTQSDPVQMLPDPAFGQPGLPSWSPVGDVSQLLIASGINTSLGTMVQCTRAPVVYTWALLQSTYSTWAAMQAQFTTWQGFKTVPAASLFGGLQGTAPQVTTNAGRIYAAVRVFAPVALSQPLALQIIDGATGAVLAEADNPVTGGVVTEWFVGYTIGSGNYSNALNWGQVQSTYATWNATAGQYWNQIDLVFYPLGQTVTAQLIQRGITTDTWFVDNLSLFEESIVWSFSNDGGTSWYPAYDIRNNPSGVMLFGPPALGTGNQLMWRAQGYRPGLVITSLAIRPWYTIYPHGYPSRPAGIGHGPNVNPLDHYPPIWSDPRWQAWDQPIPQAWFFAYQQLLLQGAVYTPVIPPAPPKPASILGSALAISAASQVPPPPPPPIAWDDVFIDVYVDSYGIGPGGDVYDDNFDDTYATNGIVTTGTVRGATAALSQGTVLAITGAQDSPKVAPLEGANLGYVPGRGTAVSDFTRATGQPLGLRRVYMGNTIPSSLANSIAAYDAGVRKVFFDFQPDATTTPSQLFTFLQDCASNGLQAEVSLWSNPDAAFTNPADFFSLLQQYVPVIQDNGYRYVFVIENTTAASGGLQTWWPGSSVRVDAMSVSLFSTGAVPGDPARVPNPNLNTAANWADYNNVPFGLAEFGADWSKISQAAGSAYLNYVLSFFRARLAARKPVGDLVYSSAGSYALPDAPPQWIALYNQISSALAKGS